MRRLVFPRLNWILTALMAAIAIVYLTLMWLPSHRAVAAVRKQLESEREFVIQSEGLPAMLADCQRQLDAAKAAVAQWEITAPRKRHLTAFFEKINALAVKAGLIVTRFDPQPFLHHEKIHEIPLVIDCSGEFPRIYEFLRNLEQLPVTIWVESIKIESAKNAASKLTCKVNLVGFSTANAEGGVSGRVAAAAADEGGGSAHPSWQQIIQWMQEDPRTTLALPLGKARDPFQSSPSAVSPR